MSKRALNYGEGQLYPALHKMEESGDIEATWIPQDGKPPRKVYAITESGKAQLQKKKVEWSKFQESITSIMGTMPEPEGNRG